jgi:hypothetical protein
MIWPHHRRFRHPSAAEQRRHDMQIGAAVLRLCFLRISRARLASLAAWMIFGAAYAGTLLVIARGLGLV